MTRVRLSKKAFRSDQGLPIANGRLFLHGAGTSNRESAFLDPDSLRAYRDWPYTLDAAGKCDLWVPSNKAFRVIIYHQGGRLRQFFQDPYYGSNAEEEVVAPPTALSNKTLIYESGQLVRVEEFTDATKQVLVKRKDLIYANGVLTTIETRDSTLALVSTRTLQYQGGVLTGLTEV